MRFWRRPRCRWLPAMTPVATDGTMGARVSLTGPAIEVGAGLGQRRGGNLFHSFERFDIATGERVTFTGPGGIRNVIGRVTGGAPSSVDGTLASTVPGADVFFINPAGILFGPSASIDVPASFHASTADELRFADGAVFSALDPAGSTLTVAPPRRCQDQHEHQRAGRWRPGRHRRHPSRSRRRRHHLHRDGGQRARRCCDGARIPPEPEQWRQRQQHDHGRRRRRARVLAVGAGRPCAGGSWTASLTARPDLEYLLNDPTSGTFVAACSL